MQHLEVWRVIEKTTPCDHNHNLCPTLSVTLTLL